VLLASYYGEDIPEEAQFYLENYAAEMGMTIDELVVAIANSQR